jgi:hypothetical protein
MKKHLLIFFIAFTYYSFSQNEYWQLFSNENIQYIKVSKSGTYELNEITFKIIWDNKLSYSENIGYYGGINTLTVYKNNERIQTFNDIEDNIALGTINFKFYDFNFDGFLDFTIPINSRWEMYFIYNSQSKKYEHLEEWDYLRVQKIDKKNKLIMTQPDGMIDNRKTYQIKGNQLIEI